MDFYKKYSLIYHGSIYEISNLVSAVKGITSISNNNNNNNNYYYHPYKIIYFYKSIAIYSLSKNLLKRNR